MCDTEHSLAWMWHPSNEYKDKGKDAQDSNCVAKAYLNKHVEG